MKILCVDDDLAFLTLYKLVLEKNKVEGDTIVVTPDPEFAINYVKDHLVDLVITDLVMPVISGLDLLREVKNIQSTVEVIVITGQGSIDSAVEAMQLGARDYVTKPINTGMLVEKIANIRELLLRVKEAEDYRYAKEVMEEKTSNDIASYEIQAEKLKEALDSIEKKLVETALTPNTKLHDIQKIVEQCCRET